jgi:hypothetical protein
VGSSLLKPPGGSPAGGPRSSSGAPTKVGEGRRSVAMNLPDRSLLAAAFVILGLAFFSVLTNVYPVASLNTQSADEPIIPVWDPSDEEPRAEQSEDDHTPTPTLLSPPTQSPPSEAAETVIDPWTSEVVEAALREPFVEGPKKLDKAANRDDLLGGAFDYPDGRLADPVLPEVESPPLENTITSSNGPALTSTDQYPDAMVQPVPSQTPPPDSPTGTEASPQPPLNLPADMDISWQLPSDSSADPEAFPQP